MDTTTAAATAGVTVATIRTWCRLGAVRATKQARRWVIDTASLTRRIALTPRKDKTVKLTEENLTAIGGRLWERGDKRRVYINHWPTLAGLEVGTYNTGNISYFAIDGRRVANGRAARIMGAIDKVYFDTADGKLHCKHNGGRAVEIRYYDGERTTLDLVQRAFDGVRAAVAAL